MKFIKNSNLTKSTEYCDNIVKNRKGKILKKQIFILLFSGALIGLLNGFFGGGGGMVCVPLLQKVLNLNEKESHATAIAVIFPLSFISACVYIFNRSVQSFPLINIGLGVVLGGILGAYFLKVMPSKIIKLIFALLMFLGGIKLII